MKNNNAKAGNDYCNSLPVKRMGVGALFLNSNDELLVLKPSYKNVWTIPGGVIDKNESPRSACIREIKEEIGLNIVDIKLLCLDYISELEGKSENLQFIFYGGVLSHEQISNIHIDGGEITDSKFLSVEDAVLLFSKKLKLRISEGVKALKNNKVVYIENGESIN